MLVQPQKNVMNLTTDSLLIKSLKPSTRPLYYINDSTYTSRPDTLVRGHIKIDSLVMPKKPVIITVFNH